jgi:hypothetical protein
MWVSIVARHVHVQFGDERHREIAEHVAECLRVAGYVVPAVEHVRRTSPIAETHIRFFDPASATHADLERLRVLLSAIGLKASRRFIPSLLPSDGPPARHYEVCLGPVATQP